MRFVVLAIAAAAALSSCKTMSFGQAPKTTMVAITTAPAGALVTVEGFGECETPCTVEIDKPRKVTIAKAGYETMRLTLEPGKRKLDVTLTLSAPTTGVDAATLPDLGEPN